jgi:NADH-quinone oxidoreductase subunit G
VAFSHYACASTRAVADVILPIGVLPEIDATLTNLEGRDQATVAAGKLPGEARAGWRVLRALGAELGAPGFEFTDLDGLRASLAPRTVAPVQGSHRRDEGNGLEVAASQAIYRSDATVRRAAALQAHPLTLGARIVLHPADAGSAGVHVAVSDKVAAGTVWIESGYGATAPLLAGKVEVRAA